MARGAGHRRHGSNPRARRTELLASFWFLTLSTAAAGPALALVTYALDRSAGNAGLLPFLVVSPDSARTILGSVAGSLITIASLTTSLTIVTLQLLSNQYTPRAVRGFLRRKISQVVSGSFIAIFAYCLLLLITVRAPGEANEPFVPSLGVVLGVALALYGLVMLVVFINTLARTIQVSTMAAELARETADAIAVVHPEPYGSGDPAHEAPRRPGDDGVGADSAGGRSLRAGRPGYVQRVDLDAPGGIAAEHPGRLEVVARAGDFVSADDVVAVWHGSGPAPDIATMVVLGNERDIDQDPGFGVRQLVDIALRAISPGINDPTTAVTCLRYLRDLAQKLAVRDLPGTRQTAVHRVTVVARQWRFDDYLAPLTEVARYAVSDARVSESLIDVLSAAAAAADGVGATDRAERARAVARALGGPALEAATNPLDEDLLRRALAFTTPAAKPGG